MLLTVATLSTLLLTALAAPSKVENLPVCDRNLGTSIRAPNPYLPSPFIFGSTVQPVPYTLDLWDCRRQEIGNLFQQYELGYLPTGPTSFSASFDNDSNDLTISAGVNGSSITWIVPIKYPASGVPSGGYPAMITYGPPTIPIPDGVANLIFDNSDFAVQNNASNRGEGLFYNLHGPNASAGAMMAWAWGVGRILDALEQTNNTGIDPTHVGISGCSRDGKGALVAGAFEERLVLTIPQESGSGGTACWRLSDYEVEHGEATQNLAEIVTENVWFSADFDTFVGNTTLLPIDHHMLMGMVAPRALLAIDNSAYAWLGPESAYGCEIAAGTVYEFLGVPDHFGHSDVGNHSHCAFPAAQQPYLTAFYDRFLLGQSSVNTSVNNTDEGSFNWTQWINWNVPTLNSTMEY